jgi:hypothetical protein
MENRNSRIEMVYTNVINVVNGAASKLAEKGASAKVVLPRLLNTMGAPAYLVGFLHRGRIFGGISVSLRQVP